MTRTLFIQSEIVKWLGGEESREIQDIKEELENNMISYSDIKSYAEDLGDKLDLVLTLEIDDMGNLYIQVVKEESGCFDEIGSWEE